MLAVRFIFGLASPPLWEQAGAAKPDEAIELSIKLRAFYCVAPIALTSQLPFKLVDRLAPA